jgi:hypothetical protein
MGRRKGPVTREVSFLLQPRQIAKIDRWAERKGTNRSEVMRQLVDRLTEPPSAPIVLDAYMKPRKARKPVRQSALVAAAQCIEEFDESLARLRSSFIPLQTSYDRASARSKQRLAAQRAARKGKPR